ncbi:hypothetical protein QAD02_003986 [Eretmocerus hayati]|uniref:Uncharacterized protein n=1 Tax=Eretmocerus hayati TaxID=131215 RepID=A0ACC2NNL3_9HYME|nr:hypothetical protein QAD02_003986 [Eretmocerus hayati]
MESEQEPHILTFIDNGIQKVVFNRPTKKNALTYQMYTELTRILDSSAMDDAVRILAVTGKGDFYSSGNDFICTFEDESFDLDQAMATMQDCINALIMYPKILIAVVNGPAIGIAATTLALFDIVYASDKAYFLTPFSKLGLSPEGCSSYTFPKIMGPSKSGEMLFFGQKLSAKDAAQIGFVSRVYKDDSISEVWDHLCKISHLSSESLSATKKLLSRWNKEFLIEVNKHEMEQLREMFAMPNFASNIMLHFMSKKSKI